ncbi:hypothetical protein SAMN05216184_10619 [Georgenia satyanarayanai]|uniref:Uncharacterized protein n=1 Tax=Georgenia satyanarayanai TaxID=860221 RepID=A0A2Y9BYC0_9MICO|nr:hypothetical protein [Georgenia satyanarayanai]PYF99507.1 hypothetical protein A8987_10619 [Georgenia satyanarayanai]SSA42352.1 hypothetical protein SAMN05216184_10619 [Georgenia satyanarayanai]
MDEDEAVSRVRGADPAAGAEPDGGRLAALTAERRGDELAARRARPRWAAVAAVAAGALVVGGAGYGIGRATEGPAADTTATAPAGRTAVGESTESMSSADTSFPGGLGGERMTFTAEGLSDAGGTATAWAFDGAGTFTEETAVRVAEVLGVEGEPRLEGGWNVGPVDGSGPTLNVGPDAAVTAHYNDPALYEGLEDVPPAEMPTDDGPAEGGDAAASGDGDAATSVVEPRPAVGAPGPGEEPSAVAPQGTAPDGPAGVLYETLAALGLDPEAAEYVEQESWAGATSVVAHHVVGGMPSGHSWYADVVDGEVLSFSGPLAPVVELGEYDVVSPAEAVERLADPRFGGSEVWSGDVSIMPAPEPDGRSWDDPPPPPPAAGAPLPWAVTDVTITTAEPGLIEHWTDEGGSLLLPAYELSDAEGRTWRVLAVADHELAS